MLLTRERKWQARSVLSTCFLGSARSFQRPPGSYKSTEAEGQQTNDTQAQTQLVAEIVSLRQQLAPPQAAASDQNLKNSCSSLKSGGVRRDLWSQSCGYRTDH